MANERSSRLTDVVEAISILKSVEKEWPRGVSNHLIKEAWNRKEGELHEEIIYPHEPEKGKEIRREEEAVSAG